MQKTTTTYYFRLFLLVSCICLACNSAYANPDTNKNDSGIGNEVQVATEKVAPKERVLPAKPVQPGLRPSRAELAALNRVKRRISGFKASLDRLQRITRDYHKINRNYLKKVNDNLQLMETLPGLTGSHAGSPDGAVAVDPASTQRVKQFSRARQQLANQSKTKASQLRNSGSQLHNDARQLNDAVSDFNTVFSVTSVKEIAQLTEDLESASRVFGDIESVLDAEHGTTPCVAKVLDDCNRPACIDCCKWRHRLTAPANSDQRKLQELARNTCINDCKTLNLGCEAADAAESGIDKAKEAWKKALQIMKEIQERQTESIRGMSN